MAVSDNRNSGRPNVCELAELHELRAWRAFFAEFYGRVFGLEQFRFLLGMEDADALGALGLSDSAWAADRLGALRAALA